MQERERRTSPYNSYMHVCVCVFVSWLRTCCGSGMRLLLLGRDWSTPSDWTRHQTWHGKGFTAELALLYLSPQSQCVFVVYISGLSQELHKGSDMCLCPWAVEQETKKDCRANECVCVHTHASCVPLTLDSVQVLCFSPALFIHDINTARATTKAGAEFWWRVRVRLPSYVSVCVFITQGRWFVEELHTD